MMSPYSLRLFIKPGRAVYGSPADLALKETNLAQGERKTMMKLIAILALVLSPCVAMAQQSYMYPHPDGSFHITTPRGTINGYPTGNGNYTLNSRDGTINMYRMPGGGYNINQWPSHPTTPDLSRPRPWER
jgi:hypothetical protein